MGVLGATGLWYRGRMSAAREEPMSLEAFLNWEGRQELKYEFDGCQPVAMTGGSFEHGVIRANVIREIGNRLRGGRCRILGSEVKIAAAGAIRYPDAFVVCTPVPRGAFVVTDPVVVFEILNPSTSSVDLFEKNREYRDTPSIQRHVILEQARPAATVYSRAGDHWVADFISGDMELDLPEIGVMVPLTVLYVDVSFAPDV
jgi:Uma2 family endonuclease